MRVLLGAVAMLLAAAGPASGVDVERRTGPEQQGAARPVTRLLADLVPDARCLRVRTLPIGGRDGHVRDLILVPCPDEVLDPPVKPWGDRPPVVIPVVPAR